LSSPQHRSSSDVDGWVMFALAFLLLGSRAVPLMMLFAQSLTGLAHSLTGETESTE
jgi:hypothetical protein